MKKSTWRIIIVLLLFGVPQNLKGEYRELTTCISADIPSDYVYHYISDTKGIYVSRDEQSMFYIEFVKIKNLPSRWRDMREMQNQYYGYDSLTVLSENKTFLLNLREDYCTRVYLTAEGDTLFCDTRRLLYDYVLATRFKDYTGSRKADFERYCDTVYSHANLFDRWRLYTGRIFWFLVIAILPVMIPGAKLRSRKGKEDRLKKSLGYGAICAVATLLIIALILGGQWDVAAIHAVVAFCLGCYARFSGEYIVFSV